MGGFSEGWQLGSESYRAALARKQQMQDAEIEAKAQQYGQDLAALRTKLATHPKGSPEYDETFAAMQNRIHDVHQLFHPDRNPGAIARLGHHLTDALGITSPKRRIEKAAGRREAEIADEYREAREEAAAAPGYQAPLLTVDELRKEARIKAGLEPRATEPKPVGENFRTQNVVLADGRTITAQQDTKSGKWLDLNGEPIPRELLAGATLAKPKKGLKWDAATGQVIDLDSGQRYASAKDAPPAVAAMFQGAESLETRKEAFQARLAGMRGTAYNLTRPLSVLDSANGNAPTYATFAQMQKDPGRYVPAGPGARAIAAENLMQDIQGTSKLTRDAIIGLKEDFPEDMKIKIAAAMRADDPHAAIDQLIASAAVGGLTPDQQDFLIATRQLAENAMAMRQILGAGQGSEDMRDAIRQTLPGLLSPDKTYAIRQLNAFDATVARLHRGVPKVRLNESSAGGGNAPPPGAEIIPWSKVK